MIYSKCIQTLRGYVSQIQQVNFAKCAQTLTLNIFPLALSVVTVEKSGYCAATNLF